MLLSLPELLKASKELIQDLERISKLNKDVHIGINTDELIVYVPQEFRGKNILIIYKKEEFIR